ncbi:MFS transporter [Nocardioides insulae]|uniref:MFS transporter n=1 Tax=Nocardioides insulae TaxID=394734 RepID=UPI0004255A8F|nr:MFS transporter [Nocardioides insulae]
MPTRSGARWGAGLARLIPPTALSRRLALQSLIFATAEGTFLTGSAVYFTQIVGLSAAQVGLGLTVGSVVAFLAAYPAGRLADRIGPKRMWWFGALLQALCFIAWPFVDGLWGYMVLVLVFEVVQNAANAGRQAYVLDVLPDDQRVATQAYMYSSLNVGYTAGALIGGIALATGSLTVLRWMPMFTLGLGLFNAWWIRRLPHAPHDLRAAARKRGERREKVPGKGPLRNPGWLLLSFFTGTLWSNQTLLHTVIPLWLVVATDSPTWLLAWLFGTNTVMCIFLPAYTSRGIHDVSGALRATRISAAFFLVSCLITMLTHETVGLVTVLLVWLGHVTVTGAELAISAGGWAFQAELMDPRRRGEYGGAKEVFNILGRGWSPALYTWLALEWDGPGWIVIGAIVVAAAIGMHPAARMAERFLRREVPASAFTPARPSATT